MIHTYISERKMHRCVQCDRFYKHKASLYNHIKFECGKNPLFTCDYPECTFTCKLKGNLTKHMKRHKDLLQPSFVDTVTEKLYIV